MKAPMVVAKLTGVPLNPAQLSPIATQAQAIATQKNVAMQAAVFRKAVLPDVFSNASKLSQPFSTTMDIALGGAPADVESAVGSLLDFMHVSFNTPMASNTSVNPGARLNGMA